MEHTFAIPSKVLITDVFRNETGFELFIRDGDLVISGELTKAQAQSALDNHNPPDPQIAIDAAKALKASAISKLIAGTPLTSDEAKLLVI